MDTHRTKALLFDVFGTVVDWRSSVIDALRGALGDDGRIDYGAFADSWRTEGYLVPIGEIVSGRRPYREVEALLRETLLTLLERHGASLEPTELEELALAWRRLEPWPDARPGLARLRRHFVVAPLSNGSFALLTEMAKRADLPWDCIISSELFHAFKPDRATYLGAATLLGLAPDEVMLVAAHPLDLWAAHAAGLGTAYVPRPDEWGTGSAPPTEPDPEFDVVATDFGALAEQLVRGTAEA